MTRLEFFSSFGLLVLCAGCSPPVVVTAPDPATLESFAGRSVTLEGKVEDSKAGYVLKTSGAPIILEYYGAQDASWPTPGTWIEVTGTLKVVTESGEQYRFRLQKPRSRLIQAPVR
jgi:hypothetical protein